MTNKTKELEDVTDIHVIAKNLTHNERIALFDYIRKTKDVSRKELLEEVKKMIDEMDFLLRPYEIEEIRLWKGRELNKWREYRFFNGVETIKKFEIMKKKLKQSLKELGEK